MGSPERPSRHRSHEKWRRIIEPAGDSDSSEWGSDSDEGARVSSFIGFQSFEPTALASSSSSSSINRENIHSQASPADQSKQSRDPSFCHALDSFKFMFNSSAGQKRYEELDAGLGTSATHYNHLLHHDYAERDVNIDRSSASDPLWYHCSMFDFGLARQRLMNKPVPVLDCSTSAGSCGLTSTTAADSVTASASSSGLRQEDVEGWRTMSNIGRLNSPSRKPLFVPSDSTAVGSAYASDATSTALDCSGAVPGSSVQLQTQAGQHECTVTSATMDEPPLPVSPPEFVRPPTSWYVQKKVQRRCNKRVRFHDSTFQHESSLPGLVPEDSSLIVSHASEDSSDVQVLSMAGPSNVRYAAGAHRVNRAIPEEPTVDESLQNTPGVVEADEGGVEIIMVDDSQPKRVEKRSISQPQECSEPSSKRIRDEDELLNQGLIGLLECPVCMEFMGPPIHQCRRGHLVCSVCKPKLPSCPTCRSRFTEARNLAMEKVADRLHYPCKNAHMGCTDTLRLRDKAEHEANCSYRGYRCVMVPHCSWKGQHNDILHHMITSHSDALLRGPEHVLEMHLGDLTVQSSKNWFVSALGELFRVNLGAVRGGHVQIFGCVLLLGPARRAPLFRYTLMVGPREDDPAQRKLLYSRTTHCYVERCSVYYSAGDSFHLRTESAQLFSVGQPDDRTLIVKLNIEKIDF